VRSELIAKKIPMFDHIMFTILRKKKNMTCYFF